MKLRTVIISLAALLLAASCTSGTEGIFASIEREQKVVSLGGLNKYATVTHMAESTYLTKYFATGGRALFSRNSSSSTTKWDNSTVGGSSEVAAVGVTGTGTSNDRVWAVANGQLYRSTDGSTWSAVSLSGDAAYDLIPVIEGADGYTAQELIVVCGTSSSHQYIYKVDNTSALGARTDLSGPYFAPVVAAVHNGSDYYLVSESFLWNWNGSAGTATKVTTTGLPTSGYAGLLYAAGNTLYVTTLNNASTGGGVYQATSTPTGTSVTFSAVKTNAQTSGGKAVSFGSLLANTNNSSLWIATGASTTTEGTGYAELSSLGASPSYSLTPNTETNNYNSTAIPTAAVGTLFRGSDGTYFLGTVAHGLWTWKASTKVWSQQ